MPNAKTQTESTKKNRASIFDRTVQKSEGWIGEMHKQLKWLDADGAYHLLRATLQALRDQLTVDEAAQFASQLPLILRGTFFECWNPKTLKKTANKKEFLDAVQQKLGPIGQPKYDLEMGVSVALNVIFNHISSGEKQDVIASLKPSLKDFLEESETAVPGASN